MGFFNILGEATKAVVNVGVRAPISIVRDTVGLVTDDEPFGDEYRRTRESFEAAGRNASRIADELD